MCILTMLCIFLFCFVFLFLKVWFFLLTYVIFEIESSDLMTDELLALNSHARINLNLNPAFHNKPGSCIKL